MQIGIGNGSTFCHIVASPPVKIPHRSQARQLNWCCDSSPWPLLWDKISEYNCEQLGLFPAIFFLIIPQLHTSTQGHCWLTEPSSTACILDYYSSVRFSQQKAVHSSAEHEHNSGSCRLYIKCEALFPSFAVNLNCTVAHMTAAGTPHTVQVQLCHCSHVTISSLNLSEIPNRFQLELPTKNKSLERKVRNIYAY